MEVIFWEQNELNVMIMIIIISLFCWQYCIFQFSYQQYIVGIIITLVQMLLPIGIFLYTRKIGNYGNDSNGDSYNGRTINDDNTPEDSNFW